MGARCCALIFTLLAVLAMLNGIAANVIGYFTCWYSSPFNNNCNQNTGYYKYCCASCHPFAQNCLNFYTTYSTGSIVAIATSWALCLIFLIIANTCRRKARRQQLAQFGYGMQAYQMNTTGTPVIAYGYNY